MFAAAAFTLALVLNIGAWRPFLLACLVGAGFFMPAPMHSWQAFYTFCILGEIVIALIALTLRAPASSMVALLNSIIAVVHGLGAWLDGGAENSPYIAIVPALGYAEFAACILLSAPLIGWVKNRVPTNL